MSLFTLIVILVVIGIVLFFLDKATIIHPKMRTVIFWVLVIAAVLIVLQFFGVIDWMRGIKVPRL